MDLVWTLVIPAAFFAAFVASIAGTGGGVILPPVLISSFGVREAVPLYAVIRFSGNLSRVGMNWREIDFKVVAGSCPARCRPPWPVHGAPVMFAGSCLGKRVMDRIPATRFIRRVECVIAGFGV